MSSLRHLPPDFAQRCERYRAEVSRIYQAEGLSARAQARLVIVREQVGLEERDAHTIEAEYVHANGAALLEQLSAHLSALEQERDELRRQLASAHEEIATPRAVATPLPTKADSPSSSEEPDPAPLLTLIEQLRPVLCALELCSHVEALDALAGRLAAKDFRLVMVGRFASGKSTLLNALCGQEVSPASEFGTTATPIEIEYSPSITMNVTMVDTPGIDNNHRTDKLVRDALCSADAAIFVIGCTTQLGTAEERFFQQCVYPLLGTEVIFVYSKTDLISPHNQARVRERLTKKTQHFSRLGADGVFFTNACDALEAHLENNHQRLERSGVPAVAMAVNSFVSERQKSRCARARILMDAAIQAVSTHTGATTEQKEACNAVKRGIGINRSLN
ncbi:MAG: GTP-binding protein [Chloroflexaceae bacterium]|nr:GTP-binding protein [Chloroflexaceae bacterium]